MSHVEGKVAVVTGGAGGFGLLVTQMLRERGATVVGFDTTDRNGCVVVDVTDGAAMVAAVDDVVVEHGRVDIMVNNAGIMPLAFFADHEAAAAAWDRCIDINVKGVLHGIAAVHDQMMEQGRGHVINISSIYSHAGSAGSGVYSATKAAVRVLSDSLRVESQGRIKVTVVRPTGVLATGLGNSVVNGGAIVGITGQNTERYVERLMAYLGGSLDEALADIDRPEYWAITPEVIAAEVLHAMDQPWGVSIADVTIRATGEDYVL